VASQISHRVLCRRQSDVTSSLERKIRRRKSSADQSKTPPPPTFTLNKYYKLDIYIRTSLLLMSAANESAFRNSLNNLGWSRRPDPDLSTAKPSFLQRLNIFNQTGYVGLPTSSQDLPAQLPARSAQQENAAWFALSQWDRIIVFACCVLGAAVCFIMAFFLMPVLVLKPRKFVMLWTVGSILFLFRFVFV